MKRLLLALACFTALSSNVWAAPAAQPAPATAPAGTPIKTLWDYQKELGLSDKQVADLKATVVDLEKFVREQQERLKPLDTQLNDQIGKEASLDQIKATLQQIAAVQIDIRVADVNTSRKINGILTADQLKKWRDIQKTARASTAQPAAPAAGTGGKKPSGQSSTSPDAGQ